MCWSLVEKLLVALDGNDDEGLGLWSLCMIINTHRYIPLLSRSGLIRKAQAIPQDLPQDLTNLLSYVFVISRSKQLIAVEIQSSPHAQRVPLCLPSSHMSQNLLSDIFESFPLLASTCVSSGRVPPVSWFSVSLRGILSGREPGALPPMVKLFWKLSEVK